MFHLNIMQACCYNSLKNENIMVMCIGSEGGMIYSSPCHSLLANCWESIAIYKINRSHTLCFQGFIVTHWIREDSSEACHGCLGFCLQTLIHAFLGHFCSIPKLLIILWIQFEWEQLYIFSLSLPSTQCPKGCHLSNINIIRCDW